MATVLQTVQGMIDATIARAVPHLVRGNDTALGTLIERDPSGLSGRATFDPSSNPVPVKVSGGIEVYVGDRVGMVRTGGYWMVVGCLSVRGMGEASVRDAPDATYTINSTSYADCSAVAPITFRKSYTSTCVEIQLDASAYASVTASSIRYGIRVTGTSDEDDTPYDSGDLDLLSHHFNADNDHRHFAGGIRITVPPVGTHTIQVRWKRLTGTAIFTMNTGDWYYFRADERRRQT